MSFLLIWCKSSKKGSEVQVNLGVKIFIILRLVFFQKHFYLILKPIVFFINLNKVNFQILFLALSSKKLKHFMYLIKNNLIILSEIL